MFSFSLKKTVVSTRPTTYRVEEQPAHSVLINRMESAIVNIRHWTAALVFSAALLGAGCEGGLFHRKDACCGTTAVPPCGCNGPGATIPAGAIPLQAAPIPGQTFGQ
jgi:hypothetical protein